MKKTYLAIAFAAVTFFACNSGTSSNTADSTTFAEGNNGTTMGAMDTSLDTQPVSDTGRQFMMAAAAGGMTEVQAAQIAVNMAKSDRVKNFANMLINDHTKANNELKTLASRLNVNLPDSVMPQQQQALEKLRNTAARNFDEQYMDMMVKDHKETIDKFQMAAQNADNNSLKTWASNTLPTLQMHLDSAQAIQSAVK